jgi:hypothetical protein
MHRRTLLVIFALLVVSIVAERDHKKTCVPNLIVNGTNLLTTHRKRLLVVGITNLACGPCQNQAVR